MLILLLCHFHNEVSDHANDEKDNESNDLGEHTDLRGVGDEGYHKSQGLPHPIVGEGGLFIGRKEATIESIDLSLPDSVSQAPEPGQDVDNIHLDRGHVMSLLMLRIGYLGDPGCPGEHDDDDGNVHEGSEHEQSRPSHQLDDVAAGEGEGGIAHSKHNDNTADDVSSVGAGHETLENFRYFTQDFW